MKVSKTDDLQIDSVWPVSTEVYAQGGIGVDWSCAAGFGQLALFWGSDHKLHADTECMDGGNDKRFTKKILELLPEFIEIDA